jgi:probable DNA repair protein
LIGINPEIFDAIEDGATLVVPSHQRAVALRIAHAHNQLGRGVRAWRSPRVRTFAAWLERSCAEGVAKRGLQLLRAGEEWLLWKRVLEEIAADDGLVVRDPIVDGVRRAAQLTADWDIPLARLRGAGGSETVLLARACARFEARAEALGCIGAWQMPARAAPAAASSRFLGFVTPTRTQRRLAGAGGLTASTEPMAISDREGGLSVAPADDPAAELALAASWCRGQLEQDPARRLLVVVPDLAGRRLHVQRQFRDVLAPHSIAGDEPALAQELLAIEGGEPLARAPLVAAALDGLQLAATRAAFADASAWLRNSFHGTLAPAVRARLDLFLRTRNRPELDLRAIVAELRFAPAALRNDADAAIVRFERALAALGDRAASAAAWSQRIRAALAVMEWPGARPLDTLEQQTRLRFEELLRELGELRTAGRPLSLREAVRLLRDLAQRVAFQPATGDPAVTLTDALEDPIVSYDGIWVMGLHAARWPEAPRPDPFVPLAAQRDAGVVEASAAGQATFASELLARWRRATTNLVLSWPRRLEEAETAPSPLLPAAAKARARPEMRIHVPLAARVRAGAPRENLLDEPVAWDSRWTLPAGTHCLELQSDCSFRAFAELRLGARELPEPRRGIDPRVRGQLLHRALELLWRELQDHAGLAGRAPEALGELIERCVREAAGELLATHERGADLRLTRREQRRAARLIAELCEIERGRRPFRAIAIERQMAIEIGGARLAVRIDRVDEIAGVGLAVIDYKTGHAGSRDWYGERPSHPQLLAYRHALGSEVRLLAMAYLARREVAFKGIGEPDFGLRGVDVLQVPSEDADAAPNARAVHWHAQAQRWQSALEGLVATFLRGEPRPDPIRQACDRCHLHGFCRVQGKGVASATEIGANGDEA